MKKNSLILNTMIQLLVFMLLSFTNGPLYKTNTGKISFFSETKAMNIDASSQALTAIINPDNNTLAFAVQNTSFRFENSFMEEHFNEKYMESEKFPRSTFSGKINEQVDLRKDGVYKVTVTGKLLIHGVEQPRTIFGEIRVSNGKLHLNSIFSVKIADHKIDIPTLVFEKIAEEIKITLEADFALNS